MSIEASWAAVFKDTKSLVSIDIASGYPYEGNIYDFKRWVTREEVKDYIKHFPELQIARVILHLTVEPEY